MTDDAQIPITTPDEEPVADAASLLRDAGCSARLMVDLSHGNSRKDHRRQVEVGTDVAEQIAAGSTEIMGSGSGPTGCR